MSEPVNDSPAEIIQKLLVDLSLAEEHTGADWPATVGRIAGGNSGVGITDTEPVQDGRLMRTGEQVMHPGIQIRTRGTRYAATRTKLMQIIKGLTEMAVPRGVTVDSTPYTIANISLASGPLYLGPEQETDFKNFTANFVVTFS